VFLFGEAVPYERVRTVWLSVRKEAQLPGTLRIHDLRHSFASHAIMAGESLFTVSRLLGHKRIQTTARYAHLADDTLRASAERIGTLILEQVEPRSRKDDAPNIRTKAGGGAS
jgi:site-specific recombinase XerD